MSKLKAKPEKIWPSLREEQALVAAGFSRVAGVDEAGRGSWAGPLVAAAAVLPLPPTLEQGEEWAALAQSLQGVNDSKQLSAARREQLFGVVCQQAEVGVGIVSALTVDLIGVGAANKLAMIRAVMALPQPPQHLLLDAFALPQLALPQTPIIRGDTLSLSIAAASIVAKVTRDQLLLQLEERFPGYHFAQNKGYGTADHAQALNQKGPCDQHRYSYRPVWAIFEKMLGNNGKQ